MCPSDTANQIGVSRSERLAGTQGPGHRPQFSTRETGTGERGGEAGHLGLITVAARGLAATSRVVEVRRVPGSWGSPDWF